MDYAEVFGPDWDKLSEESRSAYLVFATDTADDIIHFNTVTRPKWLEAAKGLGELDSVPSEEEHRDAISQQARESIGARVGDSPERIQALSDAVLRLADAMVRGEVPFPTLSGDDILSKFDRVADEIRADADDDADDGNAGDLEQSLLDRLPELISPAWLERNGVQFEWAMKQVLKRIRNS